MENLKIESNFIKMREKKSTFKNVVKVVLIIVLIYLLQVDIDELFK